MRYSLQPFLQLTGWSMTAIRQVAPCNGWEYRKRLEEGVTDETADRLATAAGLHVLSVWPEWGQDALDRGPRCGRCGEPFVASRRAQRWCSKRCRDAEAQRTYQRKKWASDPEWRAKELVRLRRYYQETRDYQLRYHRAKYAASRLAAGQRQPEAETLSR